MLPPRRSSYAPYASAPPAAPNRSPAPELNLRGSSQLRSRLLGQEEQSVMLALGLVRAATRTLLALEPKLLRAGELLSRFETPKEAAARAELGKLYDELSPHGCGRDVRRSPDLREREHGVRRRRCTPQR